MKKHPRFTRAFRNGVASLTLFLWAASVVPVLAHTHVEVVYRDGQLRLLYYDFDYGEEDPADVLLYVGVAAAAPIPNLDSFTNVLGPAGNTTWILPQTQNSDLLWLGVGNESLSTTDFVGNQYLTLLAVEGPGHFALFFNDPFGGPVTVMNTRDGVNTNDTLTLPPRSHVHCNWAFSAPGTYRVRFMVSGTLRAGNTPIASVPTDYFFEVAAPPRPVLALAQTATNAFQLTLQAHPGLNYIVEHSTNLTHWLALTNVPAPNPVTTHLLAVPPAPVQCFRARLR